jgi:hypothetical protein
LETYHDSSQVSDDLFEKKDLDKRVRALTIVTKEDEIPDLTASYFNAQHPLPAVCFAVFYSSCFSLIIICLVTLGFFSFQDHRLFVSRPSQSLVEKNISFNFLTSPEEILIKQYLVNCFTRLC